MRVRLALAWSVAREVIPRDVSPLGAIIGEGKHMDTKNMTRQLRKFFSMREGRASYEIIRKRVIAGSRIDGIHMCLLIVAMAIASIGLNTDSTEAIVGAMLICPLMGSVLALSYSVATGDSKLLKSSLVGFALQVVICLATSTLYFVISPISNQTSELLTNASPTIWDILIALAGGFAGGIGNSRRQEPATLIAGVAVATALMPPLCAAGYGLAMRQFTDFVYALYEFLLNVVFIGFGSLIILTWLKVPIMCDLDGDGVVTEEEMAIAQERSRAFRTRIIVATLLFAIPCFFVTASVVKQTREANGGGIFEIKDTYDVAITTLELNAVEPTLQSYRVGSEDEYDVQEGSITQHVVATIQTKDKLDEAVQGRLEQLVRIHVPQLDKIEFTTDGEQ